MLRIYTLTVIFFFPVSLACATSAPEPKITPPSVIKRTVIDPSELSDAAKQAIEAMRSQRLVRVDAALVEARKVVRPRAELREGPGAAYFLEDKVLTKGDLVVILDRYFRWRKVIGTESGAVGWVHVKTLGETTVSKGQITLPLASLTSLFTPWRVSRIFDYETSAVIKMQIPKGRRFYRLKKEKNKYLILIEDTLSVAWINEGDLI